MRENSATIPSISRCSNNHPAGRRRLTVLCPTCEGARWVSAVADVPLQIECPTCSGHGRLLALAIALGGQVNR